ncbi:MAG: hypothetical protein Ta2E_04700 [Mycoplasmoidaceae bacterium]|nr:MAG: hypothetical protein Ta2E_04700 [Mycoplasmoidaceae bacterium]
MSEYKNNGEHNKQKYVLASANRLIWSRILDMFICLILLVSIDSAIIFSSNHKLDNANFETWRYCLIALCLLCINFLYFIAIPFLNKKGTLGNITLKLRIYKKKGNYFFNLIKKELFLWIIPCLIITILGVFLAFLNNDKAITFINAVVSFQWSNKFDKITIYSIFFNLGLIFCFLAIILIFINVILMSGKTNMVDAFSNTIMYYKFPINDSKTNATIKEETSFANMPGIIKCEEEQW